MGTIIIFRVSINLPQHDVVHGSSQEQTYLLQDNFLVFGQINLFLNERFFPLHELSYFIGSSGFLGHVGVLYSAKFIGYFINVLFGFIFVRILSLLMRVLKNLGLFSLTKHLIPIVSMI